MAIRVYSNEQKSVARRSMNIDPVVLSFNNAINNILTMWAFPRIIAIGETVICEGVPDMPTDIQSTINGIEKQRADYIKETYPELFGL